MPVFRILLLALLFWIVFRLIKRVVGPAKSEQSESVEFEDMVSCAYCQMHLPRSSAIKQSGKTYCSSAHAQADHDAQT